MKVIDLLNKIAHGEEVPKFIKYRNWNNNSFDKMLVCKENIFYKLDQLEIYLNDEIEIIEEDKKIEKIPIIFQDGHNQTEINEYLRTMLNRVIDEVNKLKGGNDEYENIS